MDIVVDILDHNVNNTTGALICIPEHDTTIRFVLARPGRRNIMAIGLNPSTANSERLDPTSRNIQQIAVQHGYDGWFLVNLYPKRYPKPKDLPKRQNTALSLDNINVIKKLLSGETFIIDDVWLCWGNHVHDHSYLKQQSEQILDLLAKYKKQPLCIGKTSFNQPMHPAPMVVNTQLGGLKKVRLIPFTLLDS